MSRLEEGRGMLLQCPRLERKRGKTWRGPERRSKGSETYGEDRAWKSIINMEELGGRSLGLSRHPGG